MRRCLAESGSAWKVDTATNVALSRLEVVLGEAEWAATQTVHFAASFALECSTWTGIHQTKLRTPFQMARPMRLFVYLDVDSLESPC
jgi:hypothetical protein